MTARRDSFGTDSCVRCGLVVDADSIEARFVRFYQADGDPGRDLLVDFLESTFIDIPVLVNLIALCVARQALKQRTFIGMSRHKAVRDLFRVWRFREAFQDAVGESFESVLVAEDQVYRGEQQTSYSGAGGGIDSLEYDPDWKEGFPSRRNFFEFNSYVLRGGNTSHVQAGAIPRCEGAHWNGPLIQEVLRSHLPGESPKDDIARVVIYEAISNAVRHPSARVIQAVSRFDRLPVKPPSGTDGATDVLSKIGHLRICVWDDGDGIVNTLRPLVREGLPFRSVRMPSYMYDKIALQVRDFGGSFSKVDVLDQEMDPPRDAPDHLILLASTYPGVSRAVANVVEQVDPFPENRPQSDGPDRPLDKKAGMGLYALMRTVLDVYRGSVIIRSGNHLVQFEPSHDTYSGLYRVRYKAKLTVMPESLVRFRGNLVIVQIPVRQ